MKIIENKKYYIIGRCWLGEIDGFTKLGDDKEEAIELYNKYYNKKNGFDFGVTEESFHLYEVEFKEMEVNK